MTDSHMKEVANFFLLTIGFFLLAIVGIAITSKGSWEAIFIGTSFGAMALYGLYVLPEEVGYQ